MAAPVENKEKFLRLSLAENFLFSAACGIALVVAPGVVSRFLGDAVPGATTRAIRALPPNAAPSAGWAASAPIR